MCIRDRRYTRHAARIVDGNGDELHAGFLLPLGVFFGDRAQFTLARGAPRRPEVDDDGLAIVAEGAGIHLFAGQGLYRNAGHRGPVSYTHLTLPTSDLV